ncbi:MAG: hypothetical protein F6K56_33360 [Moorea sp. SIO3G5]|nr:hypothetical protein [Moorena sp. SIO3G5]
MVDKVARLYELGADIERIESYLNHWWRWVRSGVDGVSLFGLGLGLNPLINPKDYIGYRFRLGWVGYNFSCGLSTMKHSTTLIPCDTPS